jgi:hypothetical protein
MKHWYVYKIIFEDNKFYIGYRGTVKLPEQDFLITYFSSSKEVKNKIEQGILYSGQILSIYKDKEIAYNSEQELIFTEITNPNILNKFCYKDRKGWGLLTEAGKQSISDTNKKRWADPVYKEKMIATHKARWTDTLKEKQSVRLTGKSRPEHSKTMTGRKNPGASIALKGKAKPEGHGANVSAATKGIPKSKEHRLNMSLAAQDRTPEHRANMSAACKNTPKKECPYCSKILDVRNYGKYHGTKCKQYQSEDLSKK